MGHCLGAGASDRVLSHKTSAGKEGQGARGVCGREDEGVNPVPWDWFGTGLSLGAQERHAGYPVTNLETDWLEIYRRRLADSEVN